MFCIHGFDENDCPHCRAQIVVKPRDQLVELAPTELPMTSPAAEKLLQVKAMPEGNLYTSNGLLNRSIPKLQRDFSLLPHNNAQEPSLFQARIQQINEISGVAGKQMELTPDVPMVDLKKNNSKRS